jgi:hypothetical protein
MSDPDLALNQTKSDTAAHDHHAQVHALLLTGSCRQVQGLRGIDNRDDALLLEKSKMLSIVMESECQRLEPGASQVGLGSLLHRERRRSRKPDREMKSRKSPWEKKK